MRTTLEAGQRIPGVMKDRNRVLLLEACSAGYSLQKGAWKRELKRKGDHASIVPVPTHQGSAGNKYTVCFWRRKCDESIHD